MAYQELRIVKGGEMMKMKSRKGAALAIALVVVLVSGIVVAAVFRMAFQHARMSVHVRSHYTEHTILRSAVEEMKGLIFSDNINAGNIQHVNVVASNGFIDNAGLLRFGPATAAPPAANWVVNRVVISDGGQQRLIVEVYDMTFNPGQLEDDPGNNPANVPFMALVRPVGVEAYNFFFPPHTFLEANPGAVARGEIEGESADSGEAHVTIPNQQFGAYLIRARLFDGVNPNVNVDRPLRIIEEAFVQRF